MNIYLHNGTVSGKLVHVEREDDVWMRVRIFSLFSPFLSPSPFFSWLEAFLLSYFPFLLLVETHAVSTACPRCCTHNHLLVWLAQLQLLLSSCSLAKFQMDFFCERVLTMEYHPHFGKSLDPVSRSTRCTPWGWVK